MATHSLSTVSIRPSRDQHTFRMALRNVVHRRNHKERSQPAHRGKLGLLEKHKDYVQRARDHHSKQDRLKRLQQKAALRNPDEFNFGMIKAAASGDPLGRKRGQHIERRRDEESSPLPNDLVAILKSQDVGYIRNVKRAEEKRIKALKEQILSSLALLPTDWLDAKEGRREILLQNGLVQANNRRATSAGTIASTSAKKTVWVDSVEEARSYGQMHKATALGPETFDMDSLDEYSGDEEQIATSSDLSRFGKTIGKLVTELGSRQERLNALQDAQSKLETVRQLMTTRGTSAKKVQSNDKKLREAMIKGGKITANGLAIPGADHAEEDSDEDGSGKSKASKRSIWKWGRERKR